jgi:hypothetical protein
LHFYGFSAKFTVATMTGDGNTTINLYEIDSRLTQSFNNTVMLAASSTSTPRMVKNLRRRLQPPARIRTLFFQHPGVANCHATEVRSPVTRGRLWRSLM